MTLRELNAHRLRLVNAAYEDAKRALEQLASARHVAGSGEYELAYQLLQREAIGQELFQAWDALRVAQTVYAEKGPPEPAGLSKFVELARRVTQGFQDAAGRAAA